MLGESPTSKPRIFAKLASGLIRTRELVGQAAADGHAGLAQVPTR